MVTALLAEPVSNRKPSFPVRLPVTIILASCTLMGLVLRVALAGRSGIWRDEAQFLWVVRIPSLSAMLEFLRHHESHPPLLYLLMRGWLSVFGDSEKAALALPLLLGVALIPIAYRVGDRVFSCGAGLIAAAFVATSPLLARYSSMVRPYSLLPLLCVLSVYWLWCGMRKQGARPWVLHVTATLALLLTHNWAWMVLGAEWLVVTGWFTLRRQRTEWSLVRSWVLAQAVILMGYAPWFPILLYQSRHAGYDASPLHPFLAFAHFAETAVSLPVHAAVPVCLGLIVAAAWHVALRRRAGPLQDEAHRLAILMFLGIPLLAFGLATILSFKTGLLFSQCLATIAPCVLLTIAYGIASLSRMPLILTLVITSTYLFFSVKLLGEIKSNAREAAAQVAASARPTDLILIAPVWMESSFNYYYTLDNLQSNYPHEERRGAIHYQDVRERLVDPETMARARAHLAQAHREGRRVWLVMERDILSDDVLDGDRLPQALEVHTFTHIGQVRANQLRKQLNGLYGPPITIAVPGDGRGGLEILQVSLYASETAFGCASPRSPEPRPPLAETGADGNDRRRVPKG